MFDGAILDVAIGILLLFLIASLIASAVVETVAGILHRRSKNLWDTLDLLLGNTSTEGGKLQSIVNELYKQPFITGLVRPTDRLRFNPDASPNRDAPLAPKRLPLRARAPKKTKNLPMWEGKPPTQDMLKRRFYGPDHIDGREFTNALLAYLRPDGQLDQAVAAITAIETAMPDETATDIALAEIAEAVATLEECGAALGSRDFSTAVAKITSAKDTIGAADLAAALGEAQDALQNLLSGKPTTSEVVAALEKMPKDLRVKLLAVANDVGEEFEDIRDGIEDWYERTMNAASRWYRKQTRYFLFLAGLVMAVSLNVDAVHATTTLYRDESVRDSIVAIAEQVSEIECDDPGATTTTTATTTTVTTTTTVAPDPATTEAAPPTTMRPLDLECLRANVGNTLTLPIGWDDIDTNPGAWALRVLGWIIVAGAVTLGAPFWFDLLGRALAKKKKSS